MLVGLKLQQHGNFILMPARRRGEAPKGNETVPYRHQCAMQPKDLIELSQRVSLQKMFHENDATHSITQPPFTSKVAPVT